MRLLAAVPQEVPGLALAHWWVVLGSAVGGGGARGPVSSVSLLVGRASSTWLAAGFGGVQKLVLAHC